MIFQCWLEEDGQKNSKAMESFGHEEAVLEFARFCFENRDGWEWVPKRKQTFCASKEGVIKTFSIMTDFEPVFDAEELL